MTFKWDPDQDYQVAAIESVVDIFSGQPRVDAEVRFQMGSGFGVTGNGLDLTDVDILRNVRLVQERNDLTPDDALGMIDVELEGAFGSDRLVFPNFSIEMETGTGKTYVYIRTILELYRRYGMRKFIVVVPSVAIRQGVLNDLEMTREHFEQLYGNLPYEFYSYDSERLVQVRQFAESRSVEIMVMTLASFNKTANRILRETDRLDGPAPITLIQQSRPILILDEPQDMGTELGIRALAALKPLLALRYSATHRETYNLLYRLTPYEAYRRGLVKVVEVDSVVKEDDANQVFMRLNRIDSTKNTVTAKLALHKLFKGGVVKERVVTVRPGDSLEKKSSRPEYGALVVDEINPRGKFVQFTNGDRIHLGDDRGADREAIFAQQIRHTIQEHFIKQRDVRDRGVKVLSLFFIDRVDNYLPDDGLIRRLFVDAFSELQEKFEEWRGFDPTDVQGSYFARRRRKSGKFEALDSSEEVESDEDEAAYDWILRSKEQLLSFESPVAFIFSHSALGKGWDNPNIFQICTLNQTVSQVKKRQEIGRGMRLCRDQEMELVRDEETNVLTVIANESYKKYVADLQTELGGGFGEGGRPPRPRDARARGVATLNKQAALSPEFKELWERIKHRTRYRVEIDTEKLIESVVPELDQLEISPPRIIITKAQVTVDDGDVLRALQISAARSVADLVGRFPLPNLLDTMTHLLEFTTPRVRITRATLLEILQRMSSKNLFLENPQEFASEAVAIIKEHLADQLVDGIKYEKLNEWYEMTQLETQVRSWEEYLVPTNRSIYDYIACDSGIEADFVRSVEGLDWVKLYFKLPNWFKVDTPVGKYIPDWAFVVEDRDEHGNPTGKDLLYLVRETKSANFRTNHRSTEFRKTKCAEEHFEEALGIDYDIVSSADELLERVHIR